MQTWLDTICTQLGINTDSLTMERRTQLLDLARDVAHNVDRPATPLTTYLLGIAVGQGADPAQATALLSTLALGWDKTTNE